MLFLSATQVSSSLDDTSPILYWEKVNWAFSDLVEQNIGRNDKPRIMTTI